MPQIFMLRDAFDAGGALLAKSSLVTVAESLALRLIGYGAAQPVGSWYPPGSQSAQSVVMDGAQVRQTVALVGDSRIVRQSSDLQAGSPYTGYHTGESWFELFNTLTGGALRLVQSAGKSGDTIAACVARMHNPQGGPFFGNLSNPGWSGYRSDWLFVEMGVNSILAGVSVDQMETDARPMLDTARTNGQKVLWMNEMPPGPGTNWSAATKALLTGWNKRLADLAAGAYAGVLHVVDVYSRALDPSSAAGESYANLHSDGSAPYIHHANSGALLMAQAAYADHGDKFQPSRFLLPADNSEVITATNRDINQYQLHPLFDAGSLGANGFASAPTLANVTASLITDPEGYGKAVQIDVTWQAASGGSVFFVLADSAANFVGNDGELVAACRMRVGKAGASAGLLAAMTTAASLGGVVYGLAVKDAVADGDHTNYRNTGDGGTKAYRSGFEGTRVTPSYKLKAGVPQIAQVQGYIYQSGGVAGTETIRVLISRAAMRILPPIRSVTSAIG